MGFFPASDRAGILSAPIEPEPLGFGAGVAAAREATLLTDRSDSLAYQVQDAATKSLSRAKELGLESPEFPTWTWSNRLSESALTWLDGQSDAITALRGPDGPPDPFLKTGGEIRQEAAQRVAEARALASRAGLGATLVGSAAGQIPDPLNLLLLPAGAGRSATLLGKVLTEAAIGAGSQALVETTSLPAKESAGIAPTARETLGNIALTGAAGAGLATIFHGVGLVAQRVAMLHDYHAKVAAGEIRPTRETEAAADALQDALETVPPKASPKAERADLEAKQAAVEVLTAEHPVLEEAARGRFSEAVQTSIEADAEALQGIRSRVFESLDVEAASKLPPEVLETESRELVRRVMFEHGVATDPAMLDDVTQAIDGAVREFRGEPAAAEASQSVSRETPRLAVHEIADMEASIRADQKAARKAVKPEKEPKLRQTLMAHVRRRGGMDPVELRRHLKVGSLGEAGVLTMVRKGGMALDQWHESLLGEGVLPQGTTLDDFVDMLVDGRRTAEAETAAYAAEMERDGEWGPAWAAVGELDRGRMAVRQINGGTEPTLFEVEAYLADPRGYTVRAEQPAIDAEILAEMETPAPHVPENDPRTGQPFAEEWLGEADDLERFRTATEERPDLLAAYEQADGTWKAGNAREMLEELDTERKTFRSILDCVLSPDVEEE